MIDFFAFLSGDSVLVVMIVYAHFVGWQLLIRGVTYSYRGLKANMFSWIQEQENESVNRTELVSKISEHNDVAGSCSNLFSLLADSLLLLWCLLEFLRPFGVLLL